MLLRSLDPPKAMNGTRLIVTALKNNIIEAVIAVGPYRGHKMFIPRLSRTLSDSDHSVQFKRLQFPVKPCFAITINKAQGQTYKTVGIDLSSQCFTHGMLYVALSRTGDPNNLYVKSTENVRNVVYKEALL